MSLTFRAAAGLAGWTHVVDKEQTSKGAIKVTAAPVPPEIAGDDGRKEDAHEEDEGDEPVVLPADDGVAGEIGDISDTRFATGLEEHPTDVGPEEAAMGTIGIEVGVGVAMVSTVTARPPLDRALNRTCASESEKVFEGTRGIVGTMGP